MTIDNIPCLILDKWVQEIFRKNLFEEFDSLKTIREYNRESKYFDYISLMQAVANDYDITSHQLELFLFTFGKALNSSND